MQKKYKISKICLYNYPTNFSTISIISRSIFLARSSILSACAKASATYALSSNPLQFILTLSATPSTAVRAHNAPTPASETEFNVEVSCF